MATSCDLRLLASLTPEEAGERVRAAAERGDVRAYLAAGADALRRADAAGDAVAVALRPLLLELVVRVAATGALAPLARILGAFEEIYPAVDACARRSAPPTDLLTYYRLVSAAPQLAHDAAWPSAPLYHVFSNDQVDTATRALAIYTYAAHEQLSEAARDELLQRWVGDAPAALDVDGACVDVRVLPMHERERHEALWRASWDSLHVKDARTSHALIAAEADFSPELSVVGGLLFVAPRVAAPDFVLTTAVAAGLQSLALHVSLSLPVVVAGPPASGKTHLLAHLARRLRPGMSPLTIQLGDQSGVDAKQLLGSYVSSSTRPGTFAFVEGALTRAVRAGVWVILEDIDRAASDVLSVFAPLAEALGPTKRIGARPTLDLGARGRIVAAPGFALLATRSTGGKSAFLSSTHWGEVALPLPAARDVRAIVRGRFAHLARLPDAELHSLVGAWEAAAAVAATQHMRRVSLRELMAWCTRIDARAASCTSLFSHPMVQEDVFLDALDAFVAAVPAETPAVHALVEALAAHLHLSPERAAWAARDRVPELVVARGRDAAPDVRVGRVVLPRRPGASSASLAHYALTRPALGALERVAACIAAAEPALLVGETGTGKTTMVQTLAKLVGAPLTVLNLSQQTESADLLGAYRPMDPRTQAADVHNAWTALFEQTFSVRRNAAFVDAERKAFVHGRWARLAKLWAESAAMAQRELHTKRQADAGERKKRRVDSELPAAWAALADRARQFGAMFAQKRAFAFAFVEGPLVRALRAGHWLLLDEVNLAAPETLDCLAQLLQSRESSVVLTERGDIAPVPRHPDFRLFACMNPATDVGKRDLAPSLRARFTELYVPSPDADMDALVGIVGTYIGAASVGDKSAVLDMAEWYAEVRRIAARHELADGAGQRPHYSVRTLARALSFAAAIAPRYGLRRALAEGVALAFASLLDAPSAARLRAVTERRITHRARDQRVAGHVPPAPDDRHVLIGGFWLEVGPLAPDAAPDYVMTPSVEAKLGALARALVRRTSPVLIQGPTSAGKTSAVEYLARRTGHRFVRINNHEHTDVQEYLGTYASNADGQLVFTEGLLVTALRRGDWLVLDELNLAPTDVLEALNRLLDDNRELLLPETGEVVRPHPQFMLFATQNPPGAYAGRKMLSRAFRNRFVELHFDDVPQAELATILTRRCAIAPSYAERIVAVFAELQRRRPSERVFEKAAFATLRDLFRWGARGAVGYEQLADTGYMLLAERARHASDRDTVRAVIEEVMRVRIDVDELYGRAPTLRAQLGAERLAALRTAAERAGLVWTSALRRLVCLAAAALHQNEPVLLVGETGAGKTSVCDVLAAAAGRRLHSFNCHQSTDSADLLGGQRPVRHRAALAADARAAAARAGVADGALEDMAAALQRIDTPEAAAARAKMAEATALFAWVDGPLVEAMRRGEHLLLDEVSLADDSVLERLNSVLERERTLVLAEKAGDDVVVTAADGFQVIATMNPGGDYGKKELSPALRNRFTEIWVPPVDDAADQAAIVNAQLPPALRVWTERMLAFTQWFAAQVGGAEHTGLGVRDLVGWAGFLRVAHERTALSPALAFAHGAALTVMDGLGALPATAAMAPARLAALAARCYDEVNRLAAPAALRPDDPALCAVRETPEALHVGPFALRKGSADTRRPAFALEAPTTAGNALRVLRACVLPGRSVLLEGSPGAGKTSLIASLAALTRHELARINLSEQTELVDLFGAELPVEGGRPGEFAWRPAAFLDAMQRGAWVLLDEMNLASQTVLEGLNSCLDHRGSVYVPEIGRTFTKHPAFRLFAAQNPHHQGGARKGLPRSLLNRFVKVHVAELRDADLGAICAALYPGVDVAPLVRFNAALAAATHDGLGRAGAPWEFNLRDLLRWLELTTRGTGDPLDYVFALYTARLRTDADRAAAARLAADAFGRAPPTATPAALVAPHEARIGHAVVPRAAARSTAPLTLLPAQLACLEAACDSVRLGLLTIVTGAAGAGKTSLVRVLAELAGRPLEELRLSAGADTMDVLGSFEQRDDVYARRAAAAELRAALDAAAARACSSADGGTALAAAERLRAALGTAHADLGACLAEAAPLLDAETHARIRALLAVRAGGAGQFEWVDGPLVRAARRGAWILLENANLCAASVLDRLNSLFEPHGSLVLSERGMVDGGVPEVRPHPSFRVFMTVDPRYGELSRAMRNRGLEVHVGAADARVAALARVPPPLAAAPLIAAAVAAHALRRGVAFEAAATAAAGPAALAAASRLATSLSPLSEARLPQAAFVSVAARDAALREAALVYAAQALVPAEAQLLADRAVLPAFAGAGVPDVRRPYGSARDYDAREIAVRAALAAVPDDDAVRVAAVAWVARAPAHGAAVPALHAVLDAVHALRGADAAADHSARAVHVRTLRAALAELAAAGVPTPDALVRALRAAHASRTSGGVALRTLWARALPAVPPAVLTLVAALEARAVPAAHARTAAELLATAHVDVAWTAAQWAEYAGLLAACAAAPSRTVSASRAAALHPVLQWILAHDGAPGRGARQDALLARVAAHTSLPPALVVPTQLRAWGAAVPPALALRDVRALWCERGDVAPGAPGAALLTHAALLPAVLDAAHVDRVPLCDWGAYVAELDELAEAAAVALAPAQPPRDAHLRAVLHVYAREVAQALAEAAGDAGAAVRAALARGEWPAPAADALGDVLALLRDVAQADTPVAMAGVWVRLAVLALEAYLPDVPLDPVAEARAEHAFAGAVHARLRARAAVERAAEDVRTGAADNAVVAALRGAMAAAAARVAATERVRVERVPDAALLARLHRELRTFCGDVLAPARLARLLERLAAGDAHAEEASLQASLAALESRFARHYAALHDLTAPVRAALDAVRVGVSLARAAPSAARHVPLLAAATRFPTAAAAHEVAAAGAAHAAPEALATLAAAAYDTHATGCVPLASVRRAYEGLYTLWAAQRASDAEAAAAEASMYTYRGARTEDEELRALFPVYADVLETADAPREARASARVTTAVWELHLALFGGAEATRHWASHRDALVRRLCTAGTLPAHMDAVSAAYQVARLAARRAPAAPRPNFYHDAQPAELARMEPIVAGLRTHVHALLRAMPEQVQLQLLDERAARVAALDVASPVAKALAAVEQLLVAVDDWETYASRDTSLRTHAAALTQLVVAWRRLELAGWSHLLDDEAAAEERAVAPWFFPLYEAVTRGGAHAELTALLDAFVRESSVGQLRARLALLDALGAYAAAAGGAGGLLRQLAAYFVQFAPAVDAHVAARRAALDQQVAEYVQLAAWKDVNVYALQQSAQKTHTYLLRTLRKFRDELRQPAAPLLVAERPHVPVRVLGGDVAPAPVAGDGAAAAASTRRDAPAYLADLPRTVRQLRARCTLPAPRSELDALCTAVLDTSEELARQTPALATRENAKLIKSLATQKRRAWSELLRELRRLGLSPFVSAEVLAHNRDAARVHGGDAPDVPALAADAANAYHAAMLAHAERLRTAAHAPSDVPDLARGVALVEHSVHVALVVRRRFARAARAARDVCAVAARLRALSVRGVAARVSRDAVARAADLLGRARLALDEVVAAAPQHMRVSPLGGAADLAPLAALGHEADALRARLAALRESLATGLALVTPDEVELLAVTQRWRGAARAALSAAAAAAPALLLLTVPTCAWLDEAADVDVAAADPADAAAGDRVCASVLVVAQELQGVAPCDAAGDRLVRDETARLGVVDRVLRADAMVDAARAAAARADGGALHAMAECLAPYAELVWAHAAATSAWYRGLMRVSVVLSVLMTSLAQRGFCTPPEQDDEANDADAEGGEQLEGGTGLGDGTGAKDISDALEDDGAMEELDKEPGDDDGAPDGEDKARETEDVGGDTESAGDADEDAEVDDEVGDVDPLDPDAVDEKMWEGEADAAPGESEAAGGQQDEREAGRQGDREAAGDAGDAGDADDPGDADNDAEVEDMPDKNEGLGRELDKEAEQHDMQLEDLDMGEDGDRDDGDDDSDERDGQEADDKQGDKTELDYDRPEGEVDGEAVDEADGEVDSDEAADGAADSAANDEAAPETADETAEAADETAPEAAPETAHETAEAAHEAFDGNAAHDEAVNETHAEAHGNTPNEASSARDMALGRQDKGAARDTLQDAAQDAATHEGGGQDAGGALGTQERAAGDADAAPGASAPAPHGAEHDAPSSEQADAAAAPRPNPVQSLGDSLEQFRRDVASIHEARDNAAPGADGGLPEGGDVEHVAHDDDAEGQALGAADEQQARAMKQLSMDDAPGETRGEEMADDAALPDADGADAMDNGADAAAGDVARGARDTGAAHGALTGAEVRHGARDGDGDVPADEHVEPMAADERERADAEVAAALETFRASEADVARAADLWRKYAALTTDLAFALCEQLRLILVPTLATRLSGDYRTGKRLNMRKIIPFIASDFAKDKIWLRRTKPSAREYQVLLAIDDSRSMAESRNIHLAYETLALVAGALTRLEVGDIGICRFGSDVEMLHDFGCATFTDHHGGQILSHLRFQQTSTNMHALLQRSIDVLRAAREARASASAAELWQLEIIISDGVCQDHERLRAMVRRAAEERIMLVFVVVDAGADDGVQAPASGSAPPPRSSILTMNQVHYHTDAAGKLQLDMSRYIDTFPFDYYVIVRDVQSLPGVLATTLRQWAERIRDA